jgi:hypothetical protein
MESVRRLISKMLKAYQLSTVLGSGGATTGVMPVVDD